VWDFLFKFEDMKRLYKRIAKIIAMTNAQQISGRKDFEDAERIYRWLTKYDEE